MNPSPYRKGYVNKKRNLSFFSILAAGILAVALSYIIPDIKVPGPQKKTQNKTAPNKATPQTHPTPPATSKTPAPPPIPGDPKAAQTPEKEDKSYREDISQFLDGINKDAARRRGQAEPQEGAAQAHNQKETNKESKDNQSPDPAAPKGVAPAPPQYKPQIDRRRYFIHVLHDHYSLPDIIVYDSVTSEVRLLENRVVEGSLTPFDSPALSPHLNPDLRYVVTPFYKDSRIDCIVFDTYTGETRYIKGLKDNQPVTVFSRHPKAHPLRFSSRIVIDAGNIMFFVTDTFTGNVRSICREEPQAAFNLFSTPQKVYRPSRFYSIARYIGPALFLWCVDSHTGIVKNQKDINCGDNWQLFPHPTPGSHLMRYDVYPLCIGETISVFVQDAFTGEVRLYSAVNIDEPVDLFKGVDSPGYLRYQTWYSQGTLDITVYSMDMYTGEVRVSLQPRGDRFNLYKGAPVKAGQMRYDAATVFQVEGGVDIYIMDTFTSQIRLATHVKSPDSVKLF